jgi:class 3 adenylate cyclase
MKIEKEIEQVRQSLVKADKIQEELDRRAFHLKTLYDVSKDIYSSTDTKTILRSFLLMSMGNFGAVEGIITLANLPQNTTLHVVDVGLGGDDRSRFEQWSTQAVMRHPCSFELSHCEYLFEDLPDGIALALSFRVDEDWAGLYALGPKLIGDPYHKNDRELLVTLLNNLVVGLKNAHSFEEIKQLNADLEAKNIQLEAALTDLQASLRKVELLESIKENLSKFVPVTVTRMIEKSPTGVMPASRKRDLSVLFLDIEGYTRLCEKLGGLETNTIIEKHFSVFMDAIHQNNGDVNETAGDGFMVLFLDEDEKANALQAVSTALAIRGKAQEICDECSSLYRPLEINMGINSGAALVGAAKFDSYTGSRWTYTARGQVTNIAARIGAQAIKGSIYMTKTTADRIKDQYELKPVGALDLKNVSEPIDVFSL